MATANGGEPTSGNGEVREDEVVVEGEQSSVEDVASQSSAQVTVIEMGEQATSETIAEIVERSAGVQIRRLGGLGDFSSVSVRGSTWRQVQVYIDGIPLNPDGISSVNLAELPTGALSRIEVWRGNAPAHFDAAPIGGVINLITKSGDERAVSANGSATIGSYGTIIARQNSVSSRNIDNWNLTSLLAAETLSTDGNFQFFDDNATAFTLFDDQLTERQNNEKAQGNALLKISGTNDQLTISALNSFLIRDEGIPGPGVAQSLSTSHRAMQNLSTIQIENAAGVWPWNARVWELFRTDEHNDTEGEIGTGVNWELNSYSTTGSLVSVEHPWSGDLISGLTAGLRHDRWTGQDLMRNTEQAPRWRSVASLTPTVTVFVGDNITFDGAVRGQLSDNRALEVESTEGTTTTETPLPMFSYNVLPRGGLAWRPSNPISLKASAGMYQRSPDFTELFGDKGSIVGNPDLRPESGYTLDIGVKIDHSGTVGGAVEVAGFHRRTTDLITYVQNSQRTMLPVNLGASQVRGIEATIVISLWDNLQSDTSIARSWSTNLSDNETYAGNQLPNLPALELHQTTTISLMDSITASHSWSYTSGNYWDQTNWYLSAPRSIHSAFIRLDPHIGGVEAELSIRNITNRMVDIVPTNPLDPEDESVALSGLSDFHGYPLPGRTALLSLCWSI